MYSRQQRTLTQFPLYLCHDYSPQKCLQSICFLSGGKFFTLSSFFIFLLSLSFCLLFLNNKDYDVVSCLICVLFILSFPYLTRNGLTTNKLGHTFNHTCECKVLLSLKGVFLSSDIRVEPHHLSSALLMSLVWVFSMAI
jgi:hypothetical protein